jgi:hypothetical protein
MSLLMSEVMLNFATLVWFGSLQKDEAWASLQPPSTGTNRYIAPEFLSSDLPVIPTTASDIYALGCLGLKV